MARKMEQSKLWVEPVGNISVKVLYDALEMQAPSIDLVLIQQKLV